MSKFFIMTRGRTGSTAIVDELNKTKRITIAQELFLKRDYQKKVAEYENLMAEQNKSLEELYQSMLPYDLWKSHGSRWTLLFRRLLTNTLQINIYLKRLEAFALDNGVTAFGFKVLSHHFEQNPFIKDILVDRGYRAIYLRRNIPRQVISGIVAKQRGIYNARSTENIEEIGCYRIDLNEFRNLVTWEAQAVDNDLAFLNAYGYKYIVVSYEEFLSNRQTFFKRVFDFLEVPAEVPGASSFDIMIKDLKQTIENYQEIADCAAAMDMHIE